MDNSIKKFKCDKCLKMYSHVIWKSINKKNNYMCEKCWKEFDILLKIEILEKLIRKI